MKKDRFLAKLQKHIEDYNETIKEIEPDFVGYTCFEEWFSDFICFVGVENNVQYNLKVENIYIEEIKS